jgi:ribosomal protein L37AE/L43A
MVIVRNYGLLEPDNWDQDCQEQLFLMNKFWNQLVEIDRSDRAKYREIIAEDSSVSELETELNSVSEEIAKFSAERKKLRAAKRSKNVDDGLIVERIKALREREKQIRAELKILRADARLEAKPALEALNSARKDAVKQARNASGLWWGNYNAVAESYEQARAKAMKIGVDLRFRRFDGSGRFVNQIQGGVSVSEFMAGNHTVAWIDRSERSVGNRAGKPRPRLFITVYTGRDDEGKMFRRTLSFPIVLHREMPETVNGLPVTIKTLQVTRRRIGFGKFEWSVTITATTDAEVAQHEGTVAAGINLGWKKEGDSLRVATTYDTRGNHEHYRLPAQWMASMDYAESLRGDIDEATNEMFATLLSEHSDSELLSKASRPHYRLIARFAAEREIRPMRNAHLISKRNIMESISTLTAIEALPCYLAWAAAKEREFTGLRTRLLNQRKDIYRNIAVDIAKRYAVIALDNADYAKMARLELANGKENELAQVARANRFRAAPSELRLMIEQAASKHGCKIERVTQQNECASCGRPDKQDTIIWKCGHCGAIYDQDVNLAKVMIRAHLPDDFERSSGEAGAA